MGALGDAWLMIINALFDSSTAAAPPAFFQALTAAIQYLERTIANPITVNIVFAYGHTPGGSVELT
jgi:hypothetical protein